MKIQQFTSLLALTFALAACGDAGQTAQTSTAQKSAAPGSAQAAASTAPTASAASAPTGESDAVPTEADFEEEAEKDITVDNMVAELDKLEKEIGSDAP